RHASVLLVLSYPISPPFPYTTLFRSQAIDVDHRTRDVDPLLGRHLLPDQRHREQRHEVIRTDRLLRDRAQRRERLHLLREIGHQDRKSTRLNSSHEWISYAVFCLKKK